MSLVDIDSWLIEYESCARLQQKIWMQLREREKRQCLSTDYDRLTASIQTNVNQLGSELQQLKQKLLEANSNKITKAELERRYHELEELNGQLTQFKNKFKDDTRNDRASSTFHEQDENRIMLTTHNNNYKNSDVPILSHHEIIAEQNRGLETLSQTISRQRELASQMGQEVDDHNRILDNLANTMERVDSRVHVETENIGFVNRRDKTCGYWIIIILLFIAIVVVGII